MAEEPVTRMGFVKMFGPTRRGEFVAPVSLVWVPFGQ